MLTLDKWANRLLKIPNTIECPIMKIIFGSCADCEETLFVGSGSIMVNSHNETKFIMHGILQPGSIEFFSYSVGNKSSDLNWFRLIATEYDQTEWNCGWIDLHIDEILNDVCRISGVIENLVTHSNDTHTVKESNIEIIYDSELNIPTNFNLSTSVKLGDKRISFSQKRGNKIVKVVDTEIEFRHVIEGNRTLVTAKTSSLFCHPYAENWVSEPFQLLLGTLVYPRLVARNKGDGSAMISFRTVPKHNSYIPISSVLKKEHEIDNNAFWKLYCEILTMIVNERDFEGNPQFEPHKITRYYQEIAQATTSSSWVLCMTLASVAEGITNLLIPKEKRKSDISSEIFEDLNNYIKQWKGNEKLRDRILGSLSYAKEKGMIQLLKYLNSKNVIEKEHIEIWQKVRNQVMHGNLISPWEDRELEDKLYKLAELSRCLCLEYIRTKNENII